MKAILCLLLAGQAWASGFNTGEFSQCRRYFRYLQDEITLSSNHQFEDLALDAAPESWKSQHPLFYARAMQLFETYPSFAEFLPDQIEVGTPMPDLLQRARHSRNYVATQIIRLTKHYQATAPHGDMPAVGNSIHELLLRVQEAAQHLENYSPEEARNRNLGYPWFKRIDYENFAKELKRYEAATFEGKRDQLTGLRNAGSILNSFWGELRAAALLPNVLAINPHIQSLHRYLGVGKPEIEKLPHAISTREIDILWRISQKRQNPMDETYGWGEVKTLFTPLDDDDLHSSLWQRLSDSLKDQRRAATTLNLKVKFHIFLTNGLTMAARNRLMGMGYSGIHGVIVDASSQLAS